MILAPSSYANTGQVTISLSDSLLLDVDGDERHLLYFPSLCNHHVDPNGTVLSKPESTCGSVCSLIQPFHFTGEKLGPFSALRRTRPLHLTPALTSSPRMY